MILTNLTLAACDPGGVPLLRDAAVVVEGGVIRWAGLRAEAPVVRRWTWVGGW